MLWWLLFEPKCLMQRGSPPENQHATGVWSDTARSFVAVFTAVIVVARAVLAPSSWSSPRSQTLLLPRRVLQTASSRLEVSANPPPPVLVLRHRRRFRRLRRRRAGLVRSITIPVSKPPSAAPVVMVCVSRARSPKQTTPPPVRRRPHRRRGHPARLRLNLASPSQPPPPFFPRPRLRLRRVSCHVYGEVPLSQSPGQN